jgi:hypothetical protein
MGEVQRSDRDEGNSAEKKDRRERKIREHHMTVSRIPENPVEPREHCRNKGAWEKFPGAVHCRTYWNVMGSKAVGWWEKGIL